MPIVNDYILKKVGNEYMLIPTSSNNVSMSKIFNISESGVFIYNALKDNKTKEEVLVMLKNEYDAKEDILKQDLEEFIGELKKRGIYKD